MSDEITFDFLKSDKGTVKESKSIVIKEEAVLTKNGTIQLTVSDKRMELMKKTLEPFWMKIIELRNKYKDLKIDSDEQYAKAIETVGRLRKLSKNLKEAGGPVYKPIYKLYKELLSLQNFHISNIDEFIQLLQGKVNTYAQFKELERQKEEKEAEKKRADMQKKLDDMAEADGLEKVELPEVVHPKTPAAVKTTSGTATIKKKWVYEVTDSAKVPKKYMMIDHKALKEAVEKGGIRKIAGVKIYEKTETAIRAR